MAINIAILFIPLKSDEILSKKPEEKIETKVVLNLQKEEPKEILPPVIPELAEPVLETPEPEPIIIEPEILPEPEVAPAEPKPEIKKVEKPKEVKKPKKQVKKVEKKVIEPVPKRALEPVAAVEPAPIAQEVLPAPKVDTQEAKADKESYCKENIGFKILKEPVAEYPKKAIMLRLKETFYVEVDFKVTNGEINVVSVRGKNKIFNDEAVKITQDMKISVLKDINHCVITKPYEFTTKD
ncbi:energy transducer TonB [Campylobacter sp.]|uniref:energy transducer TonB n=1 Tax=Campylobacter sp. TaxID=205 RepID=UPI00403E3D0C